MLCIINTFSFKDKRLAVAFEAYLDIDVIDELYNVEPIVWQVHFDRSGFGSWSRCRNSAATFSHFRCLSLRFAWCSATMTRTSSLICLLYNYIMNTRVKDNNMISIN